MSRDNLMKYIFLLGAVVTMGACGERREAIIQAKVAERVTDFREKQWAKCRESLLREAERMADSLILADAQAALRDSLLRQRPSKPLPPAALPPIDSAPVRPIFNR